MERVYWSTISEISERWDQPKTSQANLQAGNLRSKVEKITKWNSFKRRRASEVSKYIEIKKTQVCL